MQTLTKGTATLISYQINFAGNNAGHSTMIKGSIHGKDKMILHLCPPNKLRGKGQKYKSIIVTQHFIMF